MARRKYVSAPTFLPLEFENVGIYRPQKYAHLGTAPRSGMSRYMATTVPARIPTVLWTTAASGRNRNKNLQQKKYRLITVTAFSNAHLKAYVLQAQKYYTRRSTSIFLSPVGQFLQPSPFPPSILHPPIPLRGCPPGASTFFWWVATSVRKVLKCGRRILDFFLGGEEDTGREGPQLGNQSNIRPFFSVSVSPKTRDMCEARRRRYVSKTIPRCLSFSMWIDGKWRVAGDSNERRGLACYYVGFISSQCQSSPIPPFNGAPAPAPPLPALSNRVANKQTHNRRSHEKTPLFFFLSFSRSAKKEDLILRASDCIPLLVGTYVHR